MRADAAGIGGSDEPERGEASDVHVRPRSASGVRLALRAESAVAKLRIARRENIDAFERDYLARVLAATNQNVTRAAKLAGVSRQQIQRLMIKHRVKRGDLEPGTVTPLR